MHSEQQCECLACNCSLFVEVLAHEKQRIQQSSGSYARMSCFLSVLRFSSLTDSSLCVFLGREKITWEQSAGDAGHLQSITCRPALSKRSHLMDQKQRFPHTDG